MKDEPAFINILEILALEYAKDKGYELYNFIKNYCVIKINLVLKVINKCVRMD